MKKMLVLFSMLLCTMAIAGEVRNEIMDNIMGALSLGTYISAFFFAGLGLFLRHAIIVRKAVKTNPDTPQKFNFQYWFKNNFMTKMTVVLTNIVVIFLMLRFSVEWVGMEVSMAFAFIVGLSIDWAYDIIRKMQKKVPTE